MNGIGGYGFSMLPTVVKNLLIINGLLFLATWSFDVSMGINLRHILGLHYYASPLFEPYQLVTYLFMHGDIAHLFFNMFAVWMFGAQIENAWGPKRFLIYYIITGIGASVLHYAVAYLGILQLESSFTPETFQYVIERGAEIIIYNKNFTDPDWGQLNSFYNSSLVGASGSLFGVLLAFGMMWPNANLYMMFLPIPIKAKYFVAGYGALELINGLQDRPGDNVAHFAHLGGMLFGYLLIKFWQSQAKKRYR